MSVEASTRRSVVAPVAPSSGALQPLGVRDVSIDGGFWGRRQSVNGTATMRHCATWLDRVGWLANFDATAASHAGERAGREFADSETYKLLEALAWESARTGDPAVEGLYQEIAARVVAAQQADGYLGTRFGGPGQPERYTDLEWGHELYCAGHLIQAAVARLRTSGEDALVVAARRVADHICETFGPGGIERVGGHPEIEVALTELHRATGEERYLTMARLFVARRGHGTLGAIEFGSGYFQDDVPVRDADVLRGHAVRALYLSAAAVDLAVESGDEELLATLVRQWERTVARRTFVTGGMGSRHQDESFGEDFELPADRAYSETCAGIASVMFSWRLLLATGEERFADLIERTLYNVVATGPDEDGTAFFYANPLHQRTAGDAVDTEVLNPRPAAGQRAPWFAVSCCPTNVARTMASLSGYVATVDDHGLQLHQFVPATIDAELPDGRRVAVQVQTAYPDDGTVTVTVLEDTPAPWTLSIRVPAWAAGEATLVEDDETRAVVVSGDAAEVTKAFRAGDSVALTLPMEPRWTWPDPRIDAVRGTVAVERGPLVMCAEGLDLREGLDLENLRVRTDAPPRCGAEDTVVVHSGAVRPDDERWPYARTRTSRQLEAQSEVVLIPYHRWAQRGPTTMRVWLPTADR